MDGGTPHLRDQVRHLVRLTLAHEAQRRADAHAEAADNRARAGGDPAENWAFAEGYAALAAALRRDTTGQPRP